jgi:glutathione peroxidase-family protein
MRHVGIQGISHIVANLDTSFPVFGQSRLADNPVYELMSKQLNMPESEAKVHHNFFKYLVDRNGIGM